MLPVFVRITGAVSDMAEIKAVLLREDETLAGSCPAAELCLPASRYEIADALQRARISPDHSKFCLLNICCKIPTLANYLAKAVSLDGLNLLAHRLAALSDWERIAYEGMLKTRAEWPLGELVNLTYNLSECQVAALYSDRQLGKFLAQQELLPELDGVPKVVQGWLDWARVGAYKRKAEGGVFTGGGYVVNDATEWKQIYSAALPPEEILVLDAPIQGIFRAQTETEQLDLPINDELAEQIITNVSSSIPPLERMLEPYESLVYLNEVARELMKIPQDVQPKFKAVLEYEGCADLTQSVKLSQRLEQYALFPELDTPEDYGKWELLQSLQEADFALKLLPMQAYGLAWMARNRAKRTRYGMVQKR
ncbi:MAG: hypothetical protein HFG20_11550 [Anaerotruncus sp.]|nr:hypothetical protein [Anaerotruncus sp.]